MSIYPMSEVNKHRRSSSAWIVIHNDVYDVTAFLNEHPGGADSLLGEAGRDGTTAFEDVGHSDDARKMMAKYKIGSLDPNDKNTYVYPCCPAVPQRRYGIKSQHSSRSVSSKSSKSKSPPPSKSPTLAPPNASAAHVGTIIVPREKSNKWKWILLAVGSALVAGIVYKKFVAAS